MACNKLKGITTTAGAILQNFHIRSSKKWCFALFGNLISVRYLCGSPHGNMTSNSQMEIPSLKGASPFARAAPRLPWIIMGPRRGINPEATNICPATMRQGTTRNEISLKNTSHRYASVDITTIINSHEP